MNIKLDENLPERLVSVLKDLGHDIDTVKSEQLVGHDDADVWKAAQAARRFLITQDLDFSDQRRYMPGTHAGLLLVRLAKPGRYALLERVTALFATEPVETGVAASLWPRTAKFESSGRSDDPRSWLLAAFQDSDGRLGLTKVAA